MPSLILELQKEAMDSRIKLSDSLRKALIIASKLNLEDFRKWIKKELMGYTKDDQSPDYRKIRGSVKYFNPYHGWQSVLFKTSKSQDILSTRANGQSIAELEELLSTSKPGDMLTMQISPEILNKAFPEAIELNMPPCLVVGHTEIAGIIDSVRNILLEWSIKLEKDGILGDGISFSKEEKNKASTINYQIGTFSGVIGNVQSSNLQIGDYNSIHSELKKLGVSQKERNDLEDILDGLKTASDSERKSLLKRGSEWIVRNADKIGVLSETVRKWMGLDSSL